jgi:hypothetical protein
MDASELNKMRELMKEDDALVNVSNNDRRLYHTRITAFIIVMALLSQFVVLPVICGIMLST